MSSRSRSAVRGRSLARASGALAVATGLALTSVTAVPAATGDPVSAAEQISVTELAPAAGALEVERTEERYVSSAEISEVDASVVRLNIPLPPEAGPRPERCDWLSYLRFRHASGPEDPSMADRIVITQPGIFEGAGAMESVARNTVREAAQQGRSIEFWALDRRSNCLEDRTGIEAGLATGDFSVAADYYYAGAEIDGKRFGGFDTRGSHVDWLGDQGLAQTLRDQYDLMRAEIGDQQVRNEKFLCGGHSLGGLITGYFSEWDFDGDPGTTHDAGFNQCAGYFALDSAVVAGRVSLQQSAELPFLPPAVGAVIDGARDIVDDHLPVLALPALINPETMNLLAMVGLAARLDPGGQSDVIPRLPQNANVEATIRTLLGTDYAQLITGTPRIQDADATNAAVLGAILDDNSQPFGFLQASVGFAEGGALTPKTLPVPNEVVQHVPIAQSMFGAAPKVAMTGFGPDDAYTWANYDAITREHASYTSPDREVTSIHELARNLSEPPLDFTEGYFPTRLAVDTLNSSSPDAVAHRLHRGAALHGPMLTFTAGGGMGIDAPLARNARVIELPGYAHLDVVTAAAEQNNGEPEQVSANLADFAVSLVP